MDQLSKIVGRAKARDLEAWRQLVQATEAMSYAVAKSVLHDADLARDAAQEGYLRAFRRIGELDRSEAFIVWLRRIVISVALNMRKARRSQLLRLEEAPAPPVLDEDETSWSEGQRRSLAGALVALSGEDRRLCELRYYGRWSIARLATEEGASEAAIRKRLQRIRDKLRKEIEMAEQRHISSELLTADLPAKVVELLARPRLVTIPDNPVGRIADQLRTIHQGFTEVTLPEIVDLREATQSLGADLPYLNLPGLYRIDDHRVLRSDLTLPLLMALRFEGEPLRVWSAGKAYRSERPDATHAEAFHQAELLWLDDRERLDRWTVTRDLLSAIESVLPKAAVKIVPIEFSLCTGTWELEVEHDGRWMEVLAWGVYSERVVRHLGADPARHTAIGAAYGLDRLAMLRFGVDDIRKVESAQA